MPRANLAAPDQEDGSHFTEQRVAQLSVTQWPQPLCRTSRAAAEEAIRDHLSRGAAVLWHPRRASHPDAIRVSLEATARCGTYCLEFFGSDPGLPWTRNDEAEALREGAPPAGVPPAPLD
eukprot:10663365-Alexandrium_andersonii.AAC.1